MAHTNSEMHGDRHRPARDGAEPHHAWASLLRPWFQPRRRFLPVLLGLCLLALPGPAARAAAPLQVVATTSSMGMLAREVGGDRVRVTVLAPPDRDAHYLDARPSFIRALRGADLVVAVGAELEVGWLPAALAGAANPKVLPGRPGYFEAAARVDLLGAHQHADRALGDVHPGGNPHVNMDPLRMARIALALAERLGALDEARAEVFQTRARAFAEQVEAPLQDWQKRVQGAPGAVLYHKDADYLLARLGVPVLGYVEPVPGIPPTARHLQELTSGLQGRPGVVLHTPFQPARGPEALARALDWPRQALPLEPPVDADADAYLALIESWVTALESATR